jgi:aryl carrier-like protein
MIIKMLILLKKFKNNNVSFDFVILLKKGWVEK